MDVIRVCFSITFLFTVFSIFSVSKAAIISVDWRDTGDNLITRDTVSDLDWLDLTETNNMSYNTVVTQLGMGKQFDGFRYATAAEVVTLWSRFGIDLEASAPRTIYNFIDPAVATATIYLGNTAHEYSSTSYPHGAIGMIADLYFGNPYNMGAFTTSLGYTKYRTAFSTYLSPDYQGAELGSYLVRPAAVPIFGVVWLFSSGILVLFGMARRKS